MGLQQRSARNAFGIQLTCMQAGGQPFFLRCACISSESVRARYDMDSSCSSPAHRTCMHDASQYEQQWRLQLELCASLPACCVQAACLSNSAHFFFCFFCKQHSPINLECTTQFYQSKELCALYCHSPCSSGAPFSLSPSMHLLTFVAGHLPQGIRQTVFGMALRMTVRPFASLAPLAPLAPLASRKHHSGLWTPVCSLWPLAHGL